MSFRKNVAIPICVITAVIYSPLSYSSRATDLDALFNAAENQYPQYFSPVPAITQSMNPWDYRYYSATDTYLGVNSEDQVYVIGGEFGDSLVYVGHLDSLINQQCSQRVGPFATQTTAWQRWREAQNQGYSVSNGVVPCYDGSYTRGYCFNVFFQC